MVVDYIFGGGCNVVVNVSSVVLVSEVSIMCFGVIWLESYLFIGWVSIVVRVNLVV